MSAGARTVDALDIDLDGRAELIISGPTQAPELLHLDDAQQLARREPWQVPADHALVLGDLDGDGSRDAIFYGTQLWVVAAAHEPVRAQQLSEQFDASVLGVTDLDRDGRLDLVGVRDGTLFALRQTSPLQFEKREIAKLPDADFTWDAIAVVSHAPTDVRIALLGHRSTRPQAVELALVSAQSEATTTWDDESLPLEDAPLCSKFRLP
jgi:hypothetical protein